MWTLLSLFISCLQLYLINAYEFTFELPDNKKNCYFRLIDKGTESKFEFQVISGGNYDVDLTINGPGERGKELVLFSLRQKQFESFKWISNISGEYSACFNNEFSSFSHKIIYFDWVSGEEETFGGKHPGPVNHPLTMVRPYIYAHARTLQGIGFKPTDKYGILNPLLILRWN
ncbi:unnamed protein product [Gordionus sp. m RMFG-2023]